MNPNVKRNRRRDVIAEHGASCWLCGVEVAPADFTLDHVIPRSEGGSHDAENLRAAHLACNQGRHRLGPTRSTPLAELLASAVRMLWPRRLQQELVLDLPQRKDWTDADLDVAAADFAAWLGEDLGLAQTISTSVTPPANWVELRARARRLLGATTSDQFHDTIAEMFGKASPTVRNNAALFDPARVEHAWIALLGRIDAGQTLTGVTFHTRTRHNVDIALGRLFVHVGAGTPDAADALILISLLALYQRRRQPADARAARGRAMRRRAVPKPIARLASRLYPIGASSRMLRAAEAFKYPREAAVFRSLALEWAFTVAHLAPHPTTIKPVATGPSNALALVEAAVTQVLPHLEAVEGAVVRFRLSIMADYARGTRLAVPDGCPAPYVVAHRHLADAHLANALDQKERAIVAAARMVDADEAGTLMLAPQIRAAQRRIEGLRP